jgi:hypothetical protein
MVVDTPKGPAARRPGVRSQDPTDPSLVRFTLRIM